MGDATTNVTMHNRLFRCEYGVFLTPNFLCSAERNALRYPHMFHSDDRPVVRLSTVSVCTWKSGGVAMDISSL